VGRGRPGTRKALLIGQFGPVRGVGNARSRQADWLELPPPEVPWRFLPVRLLVRVLGGVATRLDEVGLTPRQVADQLGHANPSMTLDVYFGRQVVSAEAARVLDR
jgi:integrase